MDGFDADEEWSEEEVVKSGSATALSDTDWDDPPVNTDTVTVHQLLTRRNDPADKVLDKIDAELGALSSPQKTLPLGELSNENSLFVHVEELNQSQPANSKALSPGDSQKSGTDTGVGTESQASDQETAQSPTTKTTIDRYHHRLKEENSGVQKTADGLDVLAAKQVEDKFKEVMKRKKGGYLEDLQTTAVQSDQETIKTEDFETKFNECLISTSGVITEFPAAYQSDVKTDCTSDLEAEFDKVLSKLTENLPKVTETCKPSLLQRSNSAGSLDLRRPTRWGLSRKSQTPSPHRRRKETSHNGSPRRPPSGKAAPLSDILSPGNGPGLNSSGYNSDLESIKTEDFETIFQNLLVKQGPQTSVVNHATIDTRSTPTSRQANSTLAAIMKNKEVIGKPVNSGKQGVHKADSTERFFSENPSHEKLAGEGKLAAEMAQKASALNGVRGQSGKMSHKAPGDPTEEDRSYSHKLQKWGIWQPSNFPSYFWDNEYWQRGTTRNSQSSTSTFEEVESLGYSKSSSQDSFQSESLRKDSRKKRSHLPHQFASSFQNDPGVHHISRNSSSTSLSTTDSTFDDFESVDQDIHLPSFATVIGRRGEESFKTRRHSRNRYRGQSGSGTDIGTVNKKNEHSWTSERRNRGKDLIVPDEEVSVYYPVSNDALGNHNNGIVLPADKSSNTFHKRTARDPFEHFFGYKKTNVQKGVPSLSESSIQTSCESFSSSSADQFMSRLPYESDYEYHVRIRRSLPKNIFGQRSPSIDSNSSSFTSSSSHGDSNSHRDSMVTNSHSAKQPSSAEHVLLNLGFCGNDSFLPERFARDWYDKILTSRTYMIQEMQTAELSDMWESLETTPSTQSSGMSTPWHQTTMDIGGGLGHRRRMKRSNTIGTYHESTLPAEGSAHQFTRKENDHSSVVSKQDSIDQLREILEKHASILHSGLDPTKDRRRRQFAANRQISLPLHLETLSEEEEGKSPKPRLKKGGKSFMKSFFEEEQRRFSLATQSSSEISGDEGKLPQSKQSPDTTDSESKSDNVTKANGHENCSTSSQSQAPSRVPSIIITEKPPDLQSQSSESLEIMEINRLPHSGESLEVDDILTHKTVRRLSAQLEPALISTILNDVRKENSNFLGLPKQSSGGDINEDRLAPPSPCSSLSLSPIPQSPVTVIEVTLDNQNDSLDTEDGGAAFRRDSQDQGDDVMPFERQKSPVSYFFLPRFKKCLPGTTSLNQLQRPMTCDTGIEVNSGRLSPLMFQQPLNRQEEEHTSSPVTYTEDAEVQADDGRLSPLLRTGETDEVWKILSDMDLVYRIQDQSSQCDLSQLQPALLKKKDSKERCKTEIKVTLAVPDFSKTSEACYDKKSDSSKMCVSLCASTQTDHPDTVNASCQTLDMKESTSSCTFCRQSTHCSGGTERDILCSDSNSRYCLNTANSNLCPCPLSRQSSLNETIARLSMKTRELRERYSDPFCMRGRSAEGDSSHHTVGHEIRASVSRDEPVPHAPNFDDSGASSSQGGVASPHHGFSNLCIDCDLNSGCCSSMYNCQSASGSIGIRSVGTREQDTHPMTIHCSQVNIVTQNFPNAQVFSLSLQNNPNQEQDHFVQNSTAEVPGQSHQNNSYLNPNSMNADHSDRVEAMSTHRNPSFRNTETSASQGQISGGNDILHSNGLESAANTGPSRRRGSSHFVTIPMSFNYRSHSMDDGNISDGSISNEIANRFRHSSGRTSSDWTSSASSVSFIAGGQSDGQTDTNEQTDEELARNAREIEKQSAIIQKELEFERKMKMASPTMVPKALGSTDMIYGTKTVKFENTASESIQRKQRELSSLDAKIKACQADLNGLEILIKESREQAEDARTQLMLTEFKRDNALKELEKSTQELFVKRKKVKAFDEEVKVKMEEMTEFDSLGISKDEIQAILKEREVYQSRIRHLEALQLERNELVRQLDAIKNDLFAERKHGRQEKEELIEETESVKNKLEEMQGERDELHQKLVAMEMALQKMESEKASFVQEKAQVVKDMQEKAKRESFDLQRQAARENEHQDLKFREMGTQVLQLEEDVRVRDGVIAHLRRQLESAAEKLLEEHQRRETIQSEHCRNLQNLRKDTDTAAQQVRESCFLEKQQAMESLREQLDEERRESLIKVEDRMTRKLAELENMAATKDDQIQKLEDKIRQIEEDTRREVEKVKTTSTQELHNAVQKERQLLENEREWIKQREREATRSEMKRKLTSITEELEGRGSLVKQLKQDIVKLQKDLEDQRDLTREAVREKTLAVACVRDEALVERQADIDTLKDTIVKENKSEIQKLRDLINCQGEELSKLRRDKVTNQKKDKESSTALDRTERTLINEINEECRRTAAVLGLTPLKINAASFRGDETSESVSPRPAHGRKLTTSALANLRACNEELRSHVIEMSQTVESHRAALMQAEREKNEAVEQTRNRLEREKLQEMDCLKERLIKEHVEEINKMTSARNRDKNLQVSLWQKENVVREMKHDVTMWKEDMTHKFAWKLQQELQKRQKKQAGIHQSLECANMTQQCEIERLEREVARLAQNQNRLLAEAKTENKTGQSHHQHIPRQMTSPVSREPSPSTNHLADAYEQRAKYAEREVEMAAQRANRNETMLAQKMNEMGKLHSTLTHQSKELRQLERAYNQLKNHSQHLTRSNPPPSPHARHGGPASSFTRSAPLFTSPTHQISTFHVPASSFLNSSPKGLHRPLSLSAL